MRRKSLVIALVLIGVFVSWGFAHAQEWKPKKPVTIIVPWPAGGSTDLTIRILASEMEKVLGQRIAVVNTPGASGAIGMRSAWEAPRDGYTWGSNSDTAMINLPVLDLLKVTHREWIQWYVLFAPSIIGVTPDYPAKDITELVKMMQGKPGQVTVSSAGIGSSGHTALEIFSKVTGVKVRHVPFAGGHPAVVAAVSGEVNVVMQLSMEQADMIRAKKLRPLANTGLHTLHISGYGEVPSIRKWYPNFPLTGSHFGLMVPKDTPKEVVAAISKAFDVAARSDAIKKFADARAVFPENLKEAEAMTRAERTASVVTWVMYESGAAKISPTQFNIPKAAD